MLLIRAGVNRPAHPYIPLHWRSLIAVAPASILDRYRAQNAVSEELYRRERQSVPGGSTRGAVFYRPFPLYMASGHGCHIMDVDGNERVDFMGNYSALVLGHSHPAVVAAAIEQLRLGSVYGAPCEAEIELAGLLVDRIPSVDRVVFTTTGSEAVLASLRAARAATGRTLVGKFEGGYHGSYDWVKISSKPDLSIAGPADRPVSLPDSKGIPETVVDQVCVMPFNDIGAVEETLERRGAEMAALIVEPILGSGGMIPADPMFLQRLRELTSSHNIVLIFDEIISQRLGPGGAQEWYGVLPDLSLLAKSIGGGFPIGAVGGNQEIMAVFDNSELHPSVYHSGTFNANVLSLTTGLATLNQLTAPVYAHLNRLGDLCRQRLNDLFTQMNAPLQAVGLGSLFNIHATRETIRNYRSTHTSDPTLQHELFLGLLTHGIFLAARGMGCISTPMTETDVDRFISATSAVLEQLGFDG